MFLNPMKKQLIKIGLKVPYFLLVPLFQTFLHTSGYYNEKYTAPLSLTTLVCFMGTLQSIAVTLVMEHKTSAWAIGFDMNLLAAVYAGIVSSSLAYYVQVL
ncbi:hypothetical protein HAX54_025638 [Datura stramonium]|uniref:Uncharacterized protein n=1 Tax=Datura stramonium TaxID=4076 RepID=A0ABS8V1W6_DATST|nr:hypothetical protein [Datura stramonium]